MKANYIIANMQFEVSAETHKGLFKELATIQGIFEAETQCGMCAGNDLRMVVRTVDKYEFFELRCLNSDCRARFSFGQMMEGGALFPRRKNEAGDWLPNRGWSRWDPAAAARAGE